MRHIFISHVSADDPFAAQLRVALEGLRLPVWVDSRNLHGGSKLQPEIEQAIASARQVIAVLSLQTVNSPWVRKEITYALQVEQTRKDDGYRIIPLLLPGMTPAALGNWFDQEPLAVPIELKPGGLSEALPALLAALGERLPTDSQAMASVPAQPVDELILELSDPGIATRRGQRRARATATLIYQPADPAGRAVESQRYPFTAPLGPIEHEELRWYLEEYFRWPTGVFQQRAEHTEAHLSAWGKSLYNAAVDAPAARAALTAWRTASAGAPRRVSVKVERELPAGASKKKQADSDEAASHLLALPWELLHDEGGYLMHGRHAAHIRRQLPNRKPQVRQLAALPVRVLLVSPRPDDKSVPYIDHRSSALPLVEAVENLGELVTLTVLTPPTLAALETELQRAAGANEPYAVVHFDGHGVYDRQVGLGALLFEAAPATEAAQAPASAPGGLNLVHADKLAAIVRNYGIPLVFLEACQTAQVESDPTASVAGRLLEEGVTSVVAMRLSVLVETSRRFVQAFYRALASGGRVGEAMLAGQAALKHDSYRGKIMGAGELRLHDWFVPVLYQEELDPQLFAQLPSREAAKLQEQRRRLALGELPDTLTHSFVGRSRELLAMERLLAERAYTVVRGTGGAGKTIIAVELARWLVRSGRFRRSAFVSLEQYRDARSMLDSLGRQLLPDGEHYSVAQYPDLKTALQPVTRALTDHPTIIVVDNVESVLLSGEEQGEADELASILGLCQQLLQDDSATRLVFTSRERLPAPFDAGASRLELGALDRDDAIELVEQVMANEGWTPPPTDDGRTPEEVIDLVEAVNRHARALVLLAREVASRGVRATTGNLQQIMAELERKHPGERENSLYASVELSLRRLPGEVREQVAQLAVLHGGGQLEVLAYVMEVDVDTARAIAIALIDVGLAEELAYGYLRLDPTLPAYLLTGLAADTVETLRTRWATVMIALVKSLYEQDVKNTQMVSQLFRLELPNLRGLLTWLSEYVLPEQIIGIVGYIESLLGELDQPAALAQAVRIREAANKTLGGWSRVRFNSESQSIKRLLQTGDLRTAYTAAEALRGRSLAAGETAYDGADYDIAHAHFWLGRVLKRGGQVGAALAALREAQHRFEAARGERGCVMAAAAITEQGECLCDLGRLDEAAAAYEESSKRSKRLEAYRHVAVNSAQLGSVRMDQQRYDEALAAYTDALPIFERLGELGSVATSWHQIGIVHRRAGDPEAAERAYRQSLAMAVQQGNRTGQAKTLFELGNLYRGMGRLEEAMIFYRQAMDIDVALQDQFNEGRDRNNIALTLVKLGQLAEAKVEVLRAIECGKLFGHAAEPWKNWDILLYIEAESGDDAAAGVAWRQSRDAYLAYRRDGGYAQSNTGKLCEQLRQFVQQGDSAGARQFLAQARAQRWSEALLAKLQAIVDGSRDPALGDDTTLLNSDAVEVILLIEQLT